MIALPSAFTTAGSPMDRDERRSSIRARIAEQVEIIAQLICEGRDPIAAARVLKALEMQLASEELAEGK